MSSNANTLETASEADFLQGGGEMGAVMRSMDWSLTSLGPTRSWPQSLRSALSICIGSRFPIAIYWGSKLALVYNDAWSPILGSKHPWALGRTGKEVWPEIWDTIGPLFEQVLSTGEAVYQEDSLLLMHRHGYTEECYFNFTFSPVRGEGGRVEGIFNAVIETTFRVIAERRTRVLRELGECIAAARSTQEACALAVSSLEAAPHDVPFCALYLVDAEGPQARLAACSLGIAGGPAAPELISLLDANAPWPFSQATLSGRVETVSGLVERFSVPLPGGPWPEPASGAIVAPMRVGASGSISGFLVIGANPRRAIDDEYRQFAERAAAHVATVIASATAFEGERKRAEALAEIDRAKTAFFSNVSHEFRTPLTLMLGPTQDALASAEQALTGQALERVHRNGLRLLKLVNTLLDFSRIEAGRVQAHYQPTDISAFTVDLASAFRSLVEQAGLTLTVNCPPLPEPVYVDREMYEKIVLNLISNAFKFTFEGGIHVSVAADGGQARLVVADTGTGIPVAELPHLFERFHRVEGARGRSYEGSGIGLALVQELARVHGGDVSVDSDLGKGSRFTVSLPFGTAHLAPERIEAAPPSASSGLGVAPFLGEASQWLGTGNGIALAGSTEASASASSSGADRILLADDNSDMREYVRQLLVGQGWDVEAVGDGETALQRAATRVPNLVLVDVMMPKLDGFGLLRALREDERTRLVPVILLSARAGEEAHLEGLSAGADDYLVKPFSARELLARIRTHLNTARSRQEAARVSEAARLTAEGERTKLLELLKQLPAIVNFLRGPNLIFEFVHPNATKVLGGGDILGKPLLGVLPEHRDQPFAEMLRTVYRTGKAVSGKEVLVKLIRPDNGALDDSYWSFTYLPVRNAAGDVEGVMTFDIEVTDQVLARKESESLTEELKLASQRKDEFLAMLAHELRNPMAAISMALTMSERAEGDPARTAKYRATARRQMGNLVRLVDDLLDVSRITRGKVELRKERVDLAALVQNALASARPGIDARGHELSVSLAPGPFHMEADATRLEQVVVNLLSNAAKYTEPGGNISVRLFREGAEGASQAILSVRDTGRGIPDDMLDKVFDMFVQVSPTIDRNTGGLGLGLTLVQRLVDMHGGSVTAHSDGSGKGSEFVVRLPLAEEPRPHAQPSPSLHPQVPPAARKRRILLVEDSEDVRETLRDLLEELGHEVIVAVNGLDGAVKSKELAPDVALVDIGLPGMDGYEVSRRIRAEPGGEKIFLVALTGYGGPEAKAKAENAGFDLHLTKPINFNDLHNVVNRTRGG